MPIKGLSDRDSVDARFKEIGRLRKGGEKKGNRPGRDLEYFRFVPDNGRQDIAEAFREAYGDEPTHLEVYFPFDQMERVFSSYRELYGQNRLCKLRCDGENWIDWIKGDRHYHDARGRPCTLECKDIENKCPECPCGYYGRLSVILPELWFAGKIGLVTVMTTSINDIAILSAKLVQWEPLTRKPFTLWRAPERIGVPIKGKRAAKVVSLIHLELKEEQLIAAFLEAQQQPRPMLAERADSPEWPAPEEAVWKAGEDAPPPDYHDMGDVDHEAELAEARRGGLGMDEPQAVTTETYLVGANVDYVPDWLDTDTPRLWGKLFYEARTYLGYKADQHVQNTLRKVIGNDYQDRTYSEAWAVLVDHVRAKLDNGATDPAPEWPTQEALDAWGKAVSEAGIALAIAKERLGVTDVREFAGTLEEAIRLSTRERQ